MTNEEFQSLVLKQLQMLADGQKNLAEEQKEIRKDLTKLEAKMETEVIDKVRVLFDAHSVQMDYFASLRDSQARIEENLESIRRRTIDNEIKLMEHDRELRLLRVEKQ